MALQQQFVDLKAMLLSVIATHANDPERMSSNLDAVSHTNPPTKLRNSAVIHFISKQIKIAVSITDWYNSVPNLRIKM